MMLKRVSYVTALLINIMKVRVTNGDQISIDLSNATELSGLNLDFSRFKTKDQVTIILPDGKQTSTLVSAMVPDSVDLMVVASMNDDNATQTNNEKENEIYNYIFSETSDGSSLNLIQTLDGAVLGSIVENGSVIQIRTDAENNPFVQVRNEFPPDAELPPEAELVLMQANSSDLKDAPDRSLLGLGEIRDRKVLVPPPASRDLNVISNIGVMVVWTKRAECHNSNQNSNCVITSATTNNMRALMNLAVEETNTAFSLSGVNARLNLVHSYLDTSYVEDSNNAFWIGLQDVTYDNDGKLDDVHDLREQYGADVVVFIISDSKYCGKFKFWNIYISYQARQN